MTDEVVSNVTTQALAHDDITIWTLLITSPIRGISDSIRMDISELIPCGDSWLF
jgi:hypothetical protein